MQIDIEGWTKGECTENVGDVNNKLWTVTTIVYGINDNDKSRL